MIENEIFKKTKINLNKLESFGFKKQNNIYTYTQIINENFKVEITIENEEKISGKIYDLETKEEYTNYRIENYTSGFANTIKEEYIKILEKIKNKCGIENYFVSAQANKIAEILKEKYNDIPEFAWPKFPTDGIFKNPQNNKWYALIMNIDKSKIDKSSNGKIEVINLKLNPIKIRKLLNKKGYYKAYHMNKENWITIILDETIPDEEILELIEESHNFTIKSKEWLVPANPKFYDIKNCFKKENTILWKQSNNIDKGDIIYIYVASPFFCIYINVLLQKPTYHINIKTKT